MSLKRHNTSSPECEGSPKRQRYQPANPTSTYDGAYDDDDDDEAVNVNERPHLDAYTGQSGAFPGLGTNNGDEPFYGPANDGVDYLRMVRSEARGIPHLLRAQIDTDHDGVGFDEREEEDNGGYWDEDGTYTARPETNAATIESDLPVAQRYYYDSLLAQFNVVRATMKCVPPFSAIETLTSSQPISFPAESKKARITWKQCLLNREPTPVQMACMDENSVFELVRLVAAQMRGLFQLDDVHLVKRLASWIWAMLGKCPDRGELGAEEVSELRDLARKAIDVRDWLDKKTRNLPSAEEESDEVEDEVEKLENGNLSLDINTARRRLEANSTGSGLSISGVNAAKAEEGADVREEHQPSTNLVQAARHEKMVALDMVLTVVGEFYGQRDLLELRKPWDATISG